MHSDFAESLTLSQVKESGLWIHTILFNIAEVYNTLVGSVGYLISSLRYTLPHFIAELNPILTYC